MKRTKLKRSNKTGATGGGSKYAIKHELQRKGIFALRSPLSSGRELVRVEVTASKEERDTLTAERMADNE